jgi:hypothetical protein
VSSGERPVDVSEVGLCVRCRHARRLHNARGSDFWQCLAAATDASLRRYPRLPVRDCHGFEPMDGASAA